MPLLRALSFRDWLLAILSAVTIAFIWHVWASETPEPAVTVTNSAARAIRETSQWSVQFVMHNRGDAPAQNLRVRVLSALFETPEQLQLNDDFTLANELDPGADMVRTYTTPRPAATQPVEEQKAAPASPAVAKSAPPAIPAGGRAAAPPLAVPPAPAPPQRAAQSYVLVIQADYPVGGFLSGPAHRRWYYYYREGDGAAVQLGLPMKQRMAGAADRLLP